MTETLKQRIQRHEGIRLRAYRDSLSKLTIGYGRCLDTHGISEDEAEFMLDNDIADIHQQVAVALPWAMNLDLARREVLEEMAFQLGLSGLLGFKNTLAYIQQGNYAEAAQGMLNSQWHHQTPERCEELSEIILNG